MSNYNVVHDRHKRSFRNAFPNHQFPNMNPSSDFRRFFREQNEFDSDIQEMRNIVLHRPVSSTEFSWLDPRGGSFVDEFVGTVNDLQETPTRASTHCLNVDMEVFYATLTFSSCTVKEGSRPGHCYSLIMGDSIWIGRFLDKNRKMLRAHAGQPNNVVFYSNFLKALIHLEAFSSVRSMLEEKFPSLEESAGKYSDDLRVCNDFLRMIVRKMGSSSLLVNMECVSTDSKLTMDTLDHLNGLTLCIGYFEKSETGSSVTQRKSTEMFMLCRNVHCDEGDVDVVGTEGRIYKLTFHLTCNRECSESWGPRTGDLIHLLPVGPLVNFQRQLKASHMIDACPVRIQKTLFGRDIPQAPGVMVPRLPGTFRGYQRIVRRKMTGIDTSLSELETGIDEGCLSLIRSLPSTFCDDSQKRCILTCIREMGSLDHNTSSISLINGPPGTGKTQTILSLISTLMHHSRFGHIVSAAERHNELKEHDRIHRFPANRPDALRILVCCASNNAIDKVARSIKKGVPTAAGNLYPQLVRIARNDYSYGDLKDISIVTKALPFDHKIFEPDARFPRISPSTSAVRAFAKECIVYLTTCSTAGSQSINELKVEFDLVIMDEAGQVFEPEALIAICAANRGNIINRLHVVAIGDKHQLAPILTCQYPVESFLTTNNFIGYRAKFKDQVMSLFERLLTHGRCAHSWLRRQYRSHPSIGQIQTPPIYGDIVIHPSSSTSYKNNFNDVSRNVYAFHPFTLVDTRNCHDRYESSTGVGDYTNNLEGDQISRVLFRLFATSERNQFKGKIFITAPYRSQVAYLKQHLSAYGGPLYFSSPSEDIDVVFGTVDSLQGQERPVVIVSLTRSSIEDDDLPDRSRIGFLNDDRRMNVMTSRAQHLLILIGDTSTLQKSALLSIYVDACRRGAHGAVIEMAPVEQERPGSRGGLNGPNGLTGHSNRNESGAKITTATTEGRSNGIEVGHNEGSNTGNMEN